MVTWSPQPHGGGGEGGWVGVSLLNVRLSDDVGKCE